MLQESSLLEKAANGKIKTTVYLLFKQSAV